MSAPAGSVGAGSSSTRSVRPRSSIASVATRAGRVDAARLPERLRQSSPCPTQALAVRGGFDTENGGGIASVELQDLAEHDAARWSPSRHCSSARLHNVFACLTRSASSGRSGASGSSPCASRSANSPKPYRAFRAMPLREIERRVDGDRVAHVAKRASPFHSDRCVTTRRRHSWTASSASERVAQHAERQVVERALHGRDQLLHPGTIARTRAFDGVRGELVEQGGEGHED